MTDRDIRMNERRLIAEWLRSQSWIVPYLGELADDIEEGEHECLMPCETSSS